MAKRSSNFTKREKEFLLELLTNEHTNKIVESKETDKYCLRDKNKEWEKVKCEFNCEFPLTAPRTVGQIKLLYKNLKSRQEKKADAKTELQKTGGGQFHIDVTESEHTLISGLKEQFQPLNSIYDDDVGHHDAINNFIEVPFSTTEEVEMAVTECGGLGHSLDAEPPILYLPPNTSQPTTSHSSTSISPPQIDLQQNCSIINANDLYKRKLEMLEEEHALKMKIKKKLEIKEANLKKINEERDLMKNKFERDL